MKHTTVLLTIPLSVALILTAAPLLADGAPDLAGAWRMDGDPDRPKMFLRQLVSGLEDQPTVRLVGRIESSVSDTYWSVQGIAAADNTLEMVRWIPLSELGGTPDVVKAQVLKDYGDPGRPGFVRGTVSLEYDPENDELRGTYTRLKPQWDRDTRELLNVVEVPTNTFFTRAADIPDFAVTKLAAESIRVPSTGEPWFTLRVTAQITNVGEGDCDQEFAIEMREGGPGRPQIEPERSTRPQLDSGQSVTISWVWPRDWDPVAIDVVVNPDGAVEEATRQNNQRTVWGISCAPGHPADAPRNRKVWIEVDRDGASAPPPDYSHLLELAAEKMGKPESVLCYIKLEAQRRAKIDNRTVRGSTFARALANHFLKDYLASRTNETAQAAIEDIGRYRGTSYVGTGDFYVGAASLYVPPSIRAEYPEQLPEWIYPATHFTPNGDNHAHIRFIDTHFLLGPENLGTGLFSDAAGGRNWTNVMHWATGVKYGHLPAAALHELFIGYELWHMEGFDVFGEDAINDLIAEEQGRLLGKRIRALDITCETDLIRKLDEDFRHARQWVGALLGQRREHLDECILSQEPPQTNKWWKTKETWGPWRTRTIKQMLDAGMSLEEVRSSELVDRLIEIYRLIYEADEAGWRDRGPIISDLMMDMVTGRYDDQFREAPKDWSDEWNLRIGEGAIVPDAPEPTEEGGDSDDSTDDSDSGYDGYWGRYPEQSPHAAHGVATRRSPTS